MIGTNINTGSIQFTAARAFPFGSEFAIMSRAQPSGAWAIALTFGASGDERIEGVDGQLDGRRFVVIHECKKIGDRYSCRAIPVERIDEEAKTIETGIVATL